ncbi:hypothetical protein CASFOL_033777 [Castilleja foliolosa]|uniref:Peptidase A1 domain-containing protein n=1 Tax=Castilleja foliolosa TaxID=1961234 RepID=A0ABD3BZ28_9LAMI
MYTIRKTISILIIMKSITILIAHVSILLLLSFISLSHETISTNNNNTNTGLTIDLHHLVFNPTSPQYNPSLSHSQRVAIALTRSSFNRRLLLASSSQATPTITNPEGVYYLNYFIGNPRVPLSGILDTGSDLLWTSCNSKVKPITLLKCADTRCQSLPARTCKGNTMRCTYSATYGDQSYSNGTLFTGTIAFSGAGGPQIDNAVFGCGTKNSDSEGVVGLGGGPVSLVRQFGAKKLSVCLAAFGAGTSKLQLGGNIAGGKGAVVVPLVMDSKKPTFYKVSVNTITVGNKKLNLGGNMVIDTGTTKTMFPEPFYTNFLKAVNALFDNKNGKMTPVPTDVASDLCYSVAPSNFNGITVEFVNKAQVQVLTWKPENLFLQLRQNLWCLAAGTSTIQDSIYGSAALTNFNVGLDLDHNTATFQPQTCGGGK